ncbi:tetra-peptide repeat homeobox protein 1-like [Planococcus citri]|uniref:tetra-peptide repeat homeobox protein 1-like n=1 Tax=Planococcus citri TaxID=170843 RepID=UPI0031F83760
MIIRFVVWFLLVGSLLAANEKTSSLDDSKISHHKQTVQKRSDDGSQTAPQKRGLYGLEAVEIAHADADAAPHLPSFATYSSTPVPLEYSSAGSYVESTSAYPEVIIKPSSVPVISAHSHPHPLPTPAAYEDVHVISSTPDTLVPSPSLPPHGIQLDPHVKEITVTKEVPVPYYVHVEKKVPYPVYIQVPHPYPVTVEKHVPYEVRVPVDRPVPVAVPKPYPVHVAVEKPVPVLVEKHIPYQVKVPVDRPYPVHVAVEKPVPYPVQVLVDRPVHIPKPYAVRVPVEKHIPYPVKVPVPVPVPVPVVSTHEKNYHYHEEPTYVKAYHYPSHSSKYSSPWTSLFKRDAH